MLKIIIFVVLFTSFYRITKKNNIKTSLFCPYLSFPLQNEAKLKGFNVLTLLFYKIQQFQVIQKHFPSYNQSSTMTEKKPLPVNPIIQAITQFDIHTQVQKITIQTMDSYMTGNKQAFSYIKQWQAKFIEFEARLIKAENYYRNIEMNVNSKIEIANEINTKIQKFSDQFWRGMKESQENLQAMRKHYHNLVRETGTHATNLRTQQRQIQSIQTKIAQIEKLNSQQTFKLLQKLNQTQQQNIRKNQQRRSENQDMLLQFSKAKSQLDSKIQLLDQLCKDLGLYKNQKSVLTSQLANIYEELNNRVLISDFSGIRVYVDNIQNRNKKIMDGLKDKIEKEAKTREKDFEDERAKRQGVRKDIMEKFENINLQINQKNQNLLNQIAQISNKLQQQKAATVERFSQNKTQIQDINTKLIQTFQRLQNLEADLTQKQNHIVECESNIVSINSILREMQNERRQLERIKMETKMGNQNENKNELDQKMEKILEKVVACQIQIKKSSEKSALIENSFGEKMKQLEDKLSFMSQNTNINITDIKNRAQKSHKHTQQRFQQSSNRIEQTITMILQKCQQLIIENISQFRQKFDFLNIVSKDLQIFKNKFQQQLSMNDTLNKEVKQKMDRIFGMFTKLKSDVYIKVQAITNEQNKISTKQKQMLKIETDICGLLSQIYEFISIILCIQMWKQFQQQNSNTHLSQSFKQNNQQYKIASLVQGWILELTEVSGKYRGEFITRKSLLQVCLQQHIKYGDKIKGADGFIENGKNIYMKMNEGSQYQQARRRSISRGRSNSKNKNKHRQSQLPKVYR